MTQPDTARCSFELFIFPFRSHLFPSPLLTRLSPHFIINQKAMKPDLTTHVTDVTHVTHSTTFPLSYLWC